eukprot:GHVQ01015775.1.p1 GENE.GHVQ01015775.1~~GHVQ01015775.1.p1  ORF type:complete len:1068 (+),score=107.09 GHVQ01015775.1:175-3378(+)
MRKKVDNRVRTLVEANMSHRHRSMFVIVGDNSKEQIVNLHLLLSRVASTSSTPILSSFKTPGSSTTGTCKPSVLWCYNKELGFSSHRKKRAKQVKKKIRHGSYDPNLDDPFELFIGTTPIRYCYYKETASVLGQTFGMCVLQDFEAITPDILCRTIETVSGGGIVCVLLNTMSSLRQLYSLSMESHSRYRRGDDALETMIPRFNERWILSLAHCESCLVVDDELNILPISAHAGKPNGCMSEEKFGSGTAGVDKSLIATSSTAVGCVTKPSLFDSSSASSSNDVSCVMSRLMGCALTEDQARAVQAIAECIEERVSRQTVALTAGRGRGKSAALGLSIAAAVAHSYSNIFVTSPQPENVGTVFEFVQKGLEALGMKEHADFQVTQSEEVPDPTNYNTNTAKYTVRINIFKDHRQCVQYVSPQDAEHQLGQAELLVVDEAAAIPLSLVKSMLGPYLVVLSSTINGYEGTGRSLSLKLFHDIKTQAKAGMQNNISGPTSEGSRVLRTLKELSLEEPIRYGVDDPIEKWLHRLLCLDATVPAPISSKGPLVTPSKCGLYLVDRTALFSYHPASEQFLHRLMSLFVSSHYKNSPNDMLLLADAPAHYVFVLLPPINPETDTLPDIYCAIQVCIEGALSKEAIRRSLGRGLRPSGDLLPWTVSQHFVDEDFGALSGVRVIRIATHTSLQRMGYGSEAMKQLIKYFENSGVSVDEPTGTMVGDLALGAASSKTSKKRHRDNSAKEAESSELSVLQQEVLSYREDLPPLLTATADAPLTHGVDYIGTCFGLTHDLFKFWNRRGLRPVYVRQTKNDITGEHSAIMIRPVSNPTSAVVKSEWLEGFVSDFQARMVNLLATSFHHLRTPLALSLLDPPTTKKGEENVVLDTSLPSTPGLPCLSHETIHQFLTSHDIERLKKYAQQLADESLISDLLPPLCWLFFNHRLRGLTLSYLQCAVLLALGCQRRSPSEIANEFRLPINQAMALFNKAIHKIVKYFQILQEKGADETLKRKSCENGKNRVQSHSGEDDCGADAGLEQPYLSNTSFLEEQNQEAAKVKKMLKKQKAQLLQSIGS